MFGTSALVCGKWKINWNDLGIVSSGIKYLNLPQNKGDRRNSHSGLVQEGVNPFPYEFGISVSSVPTDVLMYKKIND